MKNYAEKTQRNTRQSTVNPAAHQQTSTTCQFTDNRPTAMTQRKLQAMANRGPATRHTAQLQAMLSLPSVQQPLISQKMESKTDGPFAKFSENQGAPTGVCQFRAAKVVLNHARSHYNDGWGAAYNISNDPTLKMAVPDNVVGAGSINLGSHDAPAIEQDTDGRIKSKNCSIGYDDNLAGNATNIFACGPLGPAQWRDAPQVQQVQQQPQQVPYVHDPNNFPALGGK